MRKLFVLFILFAFTLTSNIKAQDTLDVVIDHFCECITQKQDSADKNKVKLDGMEELQTCILGVFVKDYNVIKAKYGEDFTLTAESGRMVGEEIGLRAALKCPSYVKLVTESEEVIEKASARIKEKREKQVKILTKTGIVKKVSSTSYFNITLKDDNKEENFLVLKNGEGIADFITNYKKYIGKEALIKYTISEIYNAERGEFELKKEILSIEIAE
jgi:hypothetical protein